MHVVAWTSRAWYFYQQVVPSKAQRYIGIDLNDDGALLGSLLQCLYRSLG